MVNTPLYLSSLSLLFSNHSNGKRREGVHQDTSSTCNSSSSLLIYFCPHFIIMRDIVERERVMNKQ
ncbi:hypothetical protein HanPSC8_Chr02g0055051 [Helianthus annuus]|nr:hypothetical protein HanPSC8_Chr02g0055051 [Helianthus annuus]